VRRLGVLAALLLILVPSSGSAANRAAHAGVFTGYGFDACTAPSTASLNAWSASPYRALGIYLGGTNRACADGNLNASWVSSTLASGWSLLPLYVGLQAPCVSGASLAKISSNLTTASNQGRAAADDAVSLTAKFGLPGGSPIYFDMEGYSTTNASCTKVVESFVAAWVNELRARGFVAGV
jgi:Rv2525c-like, glycoside hydrolase-like domain